MTHPVAAASRVGQAFPHASPIRHYGSERPSLTGSCIYLFGNSVVGCRDYEISCCDAFDKSRSTALREGRVHGAGIFDQSGAILTNGYMDTLAAQPRAVQFALKLIW